MVRTYTRILQSVTLCCLFLIISSFSLSAQSETEPNNSQATANLVGWNTAVTGAGICATDVDDYFMIVPPPGNKSLRLTYTASMTTAGQTGAMYFYLYNKFGAQLNSKYQALTAASITDTLDFDCYEGDTFYVRAYQWSGTCKQYSFRVLPTGHFNLKNDAEQNGSFTTAQGLAFQKDTTGHLASQMYVNGAAVTDDDDYYRCVLPAGGKSLRLTMTTRMIEPGSGGAVYYYLYNKYQQQLANQYVAASNTPRTDTLDFDCFEGDTFFVRVYQWSGGCKEYRIRTDYTNRFTLQNDAENNDAFSSAQGLSFRKDTTGHLASQRFGTTAYADNDDYYRCVIPAGGKSLRLTTKTRMISPGATGAVYYYLYNKYQQQLANLYVPATTASRSDTLDYDCYEGDTFYVRVYQWSGDCKEYSLRVDYTNHFTLTNDVEVNDDFATAQGLRFGADTTGHLVAQRYMAGTASTDVDDYYRCVVPAGTQGLRLIMSSRMITPGTTGAMYYYLYNKNRQQLDNRYVALTTTQRTDTLDFNCFEGDTFYVRVYNWSGACKEYRIRTTSTNAFTVLNDQEPNDNQMSASSVNFGDLRSGHLVSQVYNGSSITTDENDYFRCILPDNGKGVKLVVASRSVAPGASGALYAYIERKNGAALVSRYIPTTNAFRYDTLEYNCLTPDTFFVRIYNWSGDCKEYTVRTMKSSTGPIAFDIDHTRFGNDFSFMNTTRNATRFAWTFGDGKTDTVAAPVHSYGIGVFNVRLNATNVCGTRTFQDTITVDGVEKYAPKSAGSNNELGVFNIRIFGAGFDSTMSVILKAGSKEFRPYKLQCPRQSEATAFFTFATVPPATYDVSIRLANGQVYTYPQGFVVYVDSPGFHITTEISAPSRVRTGRMNAYSIRVNNDQGKIANGVRLFIVLPQGLKNDIHKTLYEPKGKMVIKGKDFDKLTIDPTFYKDVYYGGDFDPNRDTIVVDRDKLYGAIDSTTIWYDVDSLFSRPYKGRVYPIYIPYIPARSHRTISFQAATSGNGNYQIASYVEPWTMRQNPLSAEALDYIHEGGMQAAAIAELTPVPGLKQVGAAAGYIDITSQVIFAEGVDWWYGTNVADDEFYARQGTSLVGELAGELVPYNNRADDALDAANSARRRLAKNTESLQIESDIVMAGLQKNHPEFAKNMAERIKYFEGAIRRDGSALTRLQREEAVNRLTHWATKQGISLTKSQIESLLFPEEIKEKPVESLASFDPNEIYGPQGAGSQHYIRRSQEMTYDVAFENVDTALAAAQIVRVEVRLDTAKFDLRKTTFGSVRFAGKEYMFEEDRSEYFREVDLRPAKNLIVRINAKTDTISGKLYWEFLSLDPLTKNLTDDVLLGFLNPNKNSPEGEGSVTFTTHLKNEVRNNDSVSAFGQIWFDENEPIVTNTWTNRIDEGKPTSQLNSAISVSSDTVMNLALNGSDFESGLKQYRLYVKKGNGSWTPKPYIVNDVTGNIVTGEPGETYSFYVEAQDSVGIWERKEPAVEATVKLDGTPRVIPENSISLFPNPARSSVTLRLNASAVGELQIVVTNVAGQKVAKYSQSHAGGSNSYEVQLGSLQSGVYFVECFVGGNSVGSGKLVVLR